MIKGLLASALLMANGLAGYAHAAGACRAVEGGVGGTGHETFTSAPTEGGLGGTGHDNAHGNVNKQLSSAEGGLGGTGFVGVITGFGSICVDGRDIELDKETRTETQNGKATGVKLTLGQTVEVIASQKNGRLTAQAVSVRDVLSGPVQQYRKDGKTLNIMGQQVDISESVIVGDKLLSRLTGGLAPGNIRAKVSGQWRADGVLAASRIDLVDSARESAVNISGPLARADKNRLRIGITEIVVPDATGITGLQPGDRVNIRGQWRNGELVARLIQPVKPLLLASKAKHIVWEGYLRPTHEGYEAAPFRLLIDPGTRNDRIARISGNKRVRLEGVVSSQGELRVERIRLIERLWPESQQLRMNGAGEKHGEHSPDAEPPHHPPSMENHADMMPADMSRPDVIRPDSMERPMRPEQPERPEHIVRPHRPERPSRPERPVVSDRPSRPTRPETPARPTAPSRTTPVERPSRPHR